MKEKIKPIKLVLKNKPSIIGATLVEIKKSPKNEPLIKTEKLAPSEIESKAFSAKIANDKSNDKLSSKQEPLASDSEAALEINEAIIPQIKSVAPLSSSTPKKPYINNTVYENILNKLIEIYPNAFSKESPKILAIGIDKSLKANKELGLSNRKINHFLSRYCRTKQYREGHVEGVERYNLQGEASGTISEAEAIKIKELQEKGSDTVLEVNNKIEIIS